eukprot:CAMPEP_0173086900 /NCGR_PEP_ID=MMETSP1102-20130122/23285_1 /TAXON_ID=49646 /ORGANISM="Geminigera sp., Strain Caron Lab Isolate" /LENGTH=65 /DNA_ID=CAMNT_0013968043 /DNA_START=433 /DNA_END=630 /DNA_ORIENTATION=+
MNGISANGPPMARMMARRREEKVPSSAAHCTSASTPSTASAFVDDTPVVERISLYLMIAAVDATV